MANIPLDLSSKAYRITANAGNDITFAFEFIAINTTGFTFEFRIYGPDGVLIKTLTIGDGIVNTPGTNSIVHNTSVSRSIRHLDRGRSWARSSGVPMFPMFGPSQRGRSCWYDMLRD